MYDFKREVSRHTMLHILHSIVHLLFLTYVRGCVAIDFYGHLFASMFLLSWSAFLWCYNIKGKKNMVLAKDLRPIKLETTQSPQLTSTLTMERRATFSTAGRERCCSFLPVSAEWGPIWRGGRKKMDVWGSVLSLGKFLYRGRQIVSGRCATFVWHVMYQFASRTLWFQVF